MLVKMVIPSRLEQSNKRYITKKIIPHFDEKSEYENLKWDNKHFQLPPLKMDRFKELKKKYNEK